MKLDFKKMGGLIPVIVQDCSTMQVLMLGFMNEEAYGETVKTGLVTFWSRTKGRLWKKGEVSGNYLEVVSVKADCDQDSLLILVKPNGPTCHKGDVSCFGAGDKGVYFLKELFELIKARKDGKPDGSYTTSLFEKGLGEIARKVGEESIEVIVAAQSETKERLVEESGDLFYHLLVLLAEKEISIDDVIEELLRRHEA